MPPLKGMQGPPNRKKHSSGDLEGGGGAFPGARCGSSCPPGPPGKSYRPPRAAQKADKRVSGSWAKPIRAAQGVPTERSTTSHTRWGGLPPLWARDPRRPAPPRGPPVLVHVPPGPPAAAAPPVGASRKKRKAAWGAVGGTPPPRDAVTTSPVAPVGGGMALSMWSPPPQGHQPPRQAITHDTWAPRRPQGRGTRGWSARSSSPWTQLRGVGSPPPPRKHPPTTVSTPYGDADPALPGAATPLKTLWGGHLLDSDRTWSPDTGKTTPDATSRTLSAQAQHEGTT